MPAVSRSVQDGIATLVVDVPGVSVNTISKDVGRELAEQLDAIEPDSSIRGVVLTSGKPNNFIAGADIDEFVALQTEQEALDLVQRGQALINRFGALGKPVVAAINGACLGGGFETALACSYRVVTDAPSTKLGLPEVQLGIIPAAGGCQRLPRLIGARAALDLILTGKTVDAARAFRRGMANELVHPAILQSTAVAAAIRLAGGWTPDPPKTTLASLALDRNPLGRSLVFRTARKQVRNRTGGNYPAPFAAIDAISHGLSNGIEAGLKREAEHFASLAVGSVSRKLVQVFFATRELKRDPGVQGEPPQPGTADALAVVGAGFMGSGIAGTAAMRAAVDVRLRDSDLSRVQAGIANARKPMDERLKKRRMTKFEHRRLTALVSGGVDWSGFKRADIVVEAVFEDLQVKQKVFADLEEHVRDDCVLASNTSTIPITRIAEATRRPERVLGMHFFSPVERMPLLEVIVAEKTAPLAVVTAVAFGRKMGKTTIVVRDRPGFWVNRILSPYLNEAGLLIVDGVSIEKIDRVMKTYGFPVGPINLLDEVGLDVAEKASRVMHEAFGDRMRPGEAVSRMVADGRLGRKAGRGFYTYEKGKKRGVDKDVYDLFDVVDKNIPSEDVTDRLVYSMLNEAARALDEDVVRLPRDGDIGAIFGIGFPPFRGGPLRCLDDLGAANVVKVLERLRDTYGERFAPSPFLEQMAEANTAIYS